jgi:hypothetical protein
MLNADKGFREAFRTTVASFEQGKPPGAGLRIQHSVFGHGDSYHADLNGPRLAPSGQGTLSEIFHASR